MEEKAVTAYSLYNVQQKRRTKINPLNEVYPQLPQKKYQVIYADPPWDYGGKMQYDKTTIKSENEGFHKKIFLRVQISYIKIKTAEGTGCCRHSRRGLFAFYVDNRPADGKFH